MCAPSANNRFRRFLKDPRRIDYLSLRARESQVASAPETPGRYPQVADWASAAPFRIRGLAEECDPCAPNYGEAVAPGDRKTKRNTWVPGGLASSGSIRNP